MTFSIRATMAGLAALFLASVSGAAMAACGNDVAADVVGLYGERTAFDVHRGGSRIGSHETRFAMEDGRLRVNSDMTLKVKVLFITAYRFDYQSEEVWCGDTIERLAASVNDDGSRNHLTARREDGELMVTNGDGEAMAAGDVLPTNHWNAAVLDHDRVLNTLTGKVNAVEIVDMGLEEIQTATGPIMATRYEYRG
ncbi:MAG: DUF6134 family protein, partial [Sphingomonadales bacterium]